MGVPPVSRGVLMYYNMSEAGDFKTSNHILDLEVAGRYHVHFDDYPIPLDLALLCIDKLECSDQSLVGFIDADALDVTAMRQDDEFGKLLTVTRGHYSGGRFLSEGDQPRLIWSRWSSC